MCVLRASSRPPLVIDSLWPFGALFNVLGDIGTHWETDPHVKIANLNHAMVCNPVGNGALASEGWLTWLWRRACTVAAPRISRF